MYLEMLKDMLRSNKWYSSKWQTLTTSCLSELMVSLINTLIAAIVHHTRDAKFMKTKKKQSNINLYNRKFIRN